MGNHPSSNLKASDPHVVSSRTLLALRLNASPRPLPSQPQGHPQHHPPRYPSTLRSSPRGLARPGHRLYRRQSPKSLPGTAISSLSGSPHSNNSAPTHRGLAARMEKTDTKPAEPRPIRDKTSKPFDVPCGPSSQSGKQQAHGHFNSDTAAQGDSQLLSNGSMTDMYFRHPPRLPLPIEEELHTPGSPILAPEKEGLPESGELGESSDALTRKSSGLGLSAGTAEDDEAEELRMDKTRPVVPTKLGWKRGGDKIYVTGSIFQWNRKHRLHPVDGKPGCFAATISILPEHTMYNAVFKEVFY